MPPTDFRVPAVPEGFKGSPSGAFRGASPLKTELVVLPGAVADLQAFGEYAQSFGTLAPPVVPLIDALGPASAWSATRVQASAWDDYARTQEGMAWSTVRGLIDKVKPVFG